MDRVRFGRVLGRGARLAAQTAFEAVDAATAAAPAPAARRPAPAQSSSQAPPPRAAATGVVLPPVLGNAVRAARSGVAAPLREASRALWHELTGSFFALFAFSFGVATWHARADLWSGNPRDHHRFAAFVLLTLLFAYFSASSFVRARKRKIH